ncbi:OmpW family outer membrane protein [Xanthomonas campestris]|uniref:OmpW/AlkL family protein n=1 Tax=Xanthomonas campestris TaxID=339 RepID=UPI002B236D65|nr:OmpW family outer membrane protein [Xanthomonas campestris]MEA9770403.1 OmpW family outer membrane protein [Xanthomonas campestris pv. raphani]MEA9798805.1 OmpW family outer membrane protein [Xanthomonas campestris pv. raphani]MEA9830906.1 OmpW family outer membrane protein [Xanthomonas campestris pv. raphani]MEA9923049.1 OmpW family outer membrane protein [Xanthomonas campestris pv. raphani]MEA9949956.1 OmpW family outer membrane protein [Xanthomonas campestris pv. raphani]
MRSISILSLAAVSALAIAPSAFAQEATYTGDTSSTAMSSSSDTASGKHWAVVGGVALIKPKNDPAPGLDVDGGPAPTLSASYYINDNWAVELWGAADKFNHRVNADGVGKVGTVEQQPIAISGQYHFGQADNVFRPFVGVGYYESNFSNEKIDAASTTGQHVGVDTAKGVIGTVGLDMNINSTWFARADARYMRSRPELRVGGAGTGSELELDPWTVGFGVGARF